MKLKVSILAVLAIVVFFLLNALGIPKLTIEEVSEFKILKKDSRLEEPSKLPKLKFTLFKTGEKKASAAFIFEGGPLLHRKQIYHTVVLVEHPKGTLLFDSGLGTQIEEQYKDHRFYVKPMVAYQNANPIVNQLRNVGIDPKQVNDIVLSHLHWDHAGGVEDFPWAKIWSTQAGREHLKEFGVEKGYLPTQLDSKEIIWKDLNFASKPYENYSASLDWFGDGSLVFVPMEGHTAGDVGMFLNLPSGKRFFFTGDITWAREGFELPSHRTKLLRRIVDRDATVLGREIYRVHSLLQAYPNLEVVPAHDGEVIDKIGMFPKWTE
ncbi:MBL fold metallo-hydrolase [Leptospira semungkisensis]|uniref:MBL fold metallo-hydrolase n=1 Tax=Leptospira semungkisensis TaxID=2484985 RepID=A0A4R9G5B7_9LEPT|nr:MBL fold metallo-hydrolase [Leptospira semungkisensis]TGK06738.1 MBL fold metallo-hydrolase [Leptospira semungkisensis]